MDRGAEFRRYHTDDIREFLDENKNPIDYEQIVIEYEGVRDLIPIPKRLNKKRVNDKEIEEYQDKKMKHFKEICR